MEEFLPCGKRLKLVQFNADGSKGVVYRCSERTAPKANQDVLAADCQECPVRSAVVRAGIDAGTYKPKVLDTPARGKRKDTGGEGFVPCSDRLVVLLPACCGRTTEHRVCNSAESVNVGAEVGPVICEQCPVRRHS